jgi:hypothetical protein
MKSVHDISKSITVSLFENLMSIRHGDLSQNCKTKIMRGDCANTG